MKPCRLLFFCLLLSLENGSKPQAAEATRNSSFKRIRSWASEWKKEAARRVRTREMGKLPKKNIVVAKGGEESVKRIRNLNSLSTRDNITAFYGINSFSHLFPEEFRAIYLRSRHSTVSKYTPESEEREVFLPAKFDWRDKNAVTPVRNQETCGGCWAFSVVGCIESAYAMKGNILEELSVQQVIDCSYNNNGCSGGSTINALNWLNQTHVKLVRDSEYSFKAQTGLCHYFRRSDFGVSITGYAAFDFSAQEEEMKKKLVKWGPLVAIVDAISWQDYLGGIIQHHCSSGEANHAVLITGFDTTGNIPYWIVRNSWGSSWGIDGYARVKIGSNVCVNGYNSEPSHTVMKEECKGCNLNGFQKEDGYVNIPLYAKED